MNWKADSCLYDTVRKEFDLGTFAIVDNSEVGLETFKRHLLYEGVNIELHNCDLLNGLDIGKYDFNYSLSLNGHFDVQNTAKVKNLILNV